VADRADDVLGQGPDEADTLVDALAQTTFVVTAVLLRLGAEHDLSLTQLRVLGILRDRDRVRVTALAHRLGLEKSTMTGLVDRGVRRGLLERRPSPDDGRAVDVLLTPAGRHLAVQLYAAVAAALTGLAQGLAPAEQRRLTVLLGRLLAPVR
jgi:DNA-binding MarR family transcriptional regulator